MNQGYKGQYFLALFFPIKGLLLSCETCQEKIVSNLLKNFHGVIPVSFRNERTFIGIQLTCFSHILKLPLLEQLFRQRRKKICRQMKFSWQWHGICGRALWNIRLKSKLTNLYPMA
jgi:hypothetical protein